MRTKLIATVVLIGAGYAAGDDGSSSPINTDRPAVTDSSVVVPVGSLQFENGFEDAASDGLRTLDGPETLLRLGVGSKTELRLTTPDYFSESGASSGFGDVTIGMKQQLGPEQIRQQKMSWEAFVIEARQPNPKVVATLAAYGTFELIHSLQLVMQWPL